MNRAKWTKSRAKFRNVLGQDCSCTSPWSKTNSLLEKRDASLHPVIPCILKTNSRVCWNCRLKKKPNSKNSKQLYCSFASGREKTLCVFTKHRESRLGPRVLTFSSCIFALGRTSGYCVTLCHTVSLCVTLCQLVPASLNTLWSTSHSFHSSRGFKSR